MDNESESEPIVRFVPLHLFARQVHVLLKENGGRLLLSNFETNYTERFGLCKPTQYDHTSISSLLQAVSNVVVLRGKGPRRVIILNREMAGNCKFTNIPIFSKDISDELKAEFKLIDVMLRFLEMVES